MAVDAPIGKAERELRRVAAAQSLEQVGKEDAEHRVADRKDPLASQAIAAPVVDSGQAVDAARARFLARRKQAKKK